MQVVKMIDPITGFLKLPQIYTVYKQQNM